MKNRSKVYIMMNAEDTYDITLINTMEALIQKLRLRQTDKNRLYRIEQLQTHLDTLEGLYVGRVPEVYEVRADKFDDAINAALKELASPL